MLVVGAISFNSLKRFTQPTLVLSTLKHLLQKDAFVLKVQLIPTVTCKINEEKYAGLLLPAKPCTQNIQHALLALSKDAEFADIISKSRFLSTLNSYTIRGPSGGVIKADVLPGLAVAGHMMTVWSTRLISRGGMETLEYWLVDPSTDVSTFIKVFVRDKRLITEGQMIQYALDNRFEPDMLEGCAEHGPHKFSFAKRLTAPPIIIS